MSNLINLIVPPIIIVVSIVLLIVFLAKVSPRSEERKNKKNGNLRAENNSYVSNSSEIENVENFQDEEESNLQNNNFQREVFNKVEKKKEKTTFFQNLFSKFKSSSPDFNQNKKSSSFNGLKSHISSKLSSVKNSVSSVKNNLISDKNESNKGQVSIMSEILLNNKNNTNNFSVAINEESELVKQISLDPKNPESYRRLGDFYVRNDRLQDARECYRYVLRLDPRHKRAQLAMARLDRILA